MRLAILSVKFVPILVSIALIIQCILALLDMRTTGFVSTIYGHSILYNAMLLALSKAFRFCFWHRVIILNLILINLIEWVDRNLFSFDSLQYVWMLIILLLASSLVATLLYIRYGCFKRNNKAFDSRSRANG